MNTSEDFFFCCWKISCRYIIKHIISSNCKIMSSIKLHYRNYSKVPPSNSSTPCLKPKIWHTSSLTLRPEKKVKVDGKLLTNIPTSWAGWNYSSSQKTVGMSYVGTSAENWIHSRSRQILRTVSKDSSRIFLSKKVRFNG